MSGSNDDSSSKDQSLSLLGSVASIEHGGAKAALQQLLDEELDKARWLDEHLASTTLRYLGRSEAGMKAGLILPRFHGHWG